MRYLVRKMSQGITAVVSLAASAGLLTSDASPPQPVASVTQGPALAATPDVPQTKSSESASHPSIITGAAVQVATGVSMRPAQNHQVDPSSASPR